MKLQGIRESTNYQEAGDSFTRAWNNYLQANMDPLGISINKDPQPYALGDSLSQAQLHHILKMIDDFHRGKLNTSDRMPKGQSFDDNWFHMFSPDEKTQYGF